MRAPIAALQVCAADDPLVLRAHGELDLAGGDEIASWIKDAVFFAPRVMLDLTAVTFCSSAGLAMLAQCATLANAVESELVIVPGRRVARLLAIAELEHLVRTDSAAPAPSPVCSS